jgi:hypothetical protein
MRAFFIYGMGKPCPASVKNKHVLIKRNHPRWDQLPLSQQDLSLDYYKKLLTTASNAFDTLRKVRFAEAMLNGFKLGLRALNNRSLKPFTRTG